MRVLNLAIQGFRCFQADQVLRFPAHSGFFLLTGDNRLHPELGANAAGKSTVWDALVWVLFGKTARGLRGKDVANWEGDTLCSVHVDLEVEGREFALTRTWQPNSLSIQDAGQEPRVLEQQELEQRLGCDYASFMSCVVMGQFNRFFFDLSPTEKLNLFSEALDLHLWLKASQSAAAQAKELAAAQAQAERELADISGRASAVEEQVESLRQRNKQFEAERKRDLDEARERRDTAKRALAKAEEALAGSRKVLHKAQDDKEQLERKLVQLDDQSRELRSHASDCNASFQVQRSRTNDLVAQAQAIITLSSVCPTCRQQVSDQHRRHIKQALAPEVLAAKKQLEEATRSSQQAQAASQAVEDKINAVGKQLQDLDRQLATTRREVGQAQAAEQQARAQAEHYKELLDLRQRAGNPYSDQLEQAENLSAALRKRRKKLERQVKQAVRQHLAVSYWSAGFKDLRLWLIEQALLELEVRVNNSLAELGLDGWRVAFDVERETASGGVLRGFAVSVLPPGEPLGVPWESWSGGETQRLRIAGALGLASLISSRRGFFPQLEVWDEPTAHLSQEGINDLLAFFAARARSEDKQIWLVDHRSLNYGDFDQEFMVVRELAGSRIQTRRSSSA